MLIFRGYEDRYYQSIYEWNRIHLGISRDRFMRLHNTLIINDDNRIALHAREKINVVIRIQNGYPYWVDMLWKTRSGDPFTFPIEASENLWRYKIVVSCKKLILSSIQQSIIY